MGNKRTEIARDFELEEVDLLTMETEFFNEQKSHQADDDDDVEVTNV